MCFKSSGNSDEACQSLSLHYRGLVFNDLFRGSSVGQHAGFFIGMVVFDMATTAINNYMDFKKPNQTSINMKKILSDNQAFQWLHDGLRHLRLNRLLERRHQSAFLLNGRFC